MNTNHCRGVEIVFFTDIDDTLMQTKRKCPVGDSELIVGARDRDGNALSFLTKKQLALFQCMSKNTTVIPVTGRNLPALERTDIKLDCAPFRITGHGAEVTDAGGQVPSGWCPPEGHKQQQEQLQILSQQVHGWIKERPQLRVKLVTERDSVPVYLSVKGSRSTDNRQVLSAFIQQFSPVMKQWNWKIHSNGNNVALLPSFACKARAVRFVRQEIEKTSGNHLSIGAGDSHSDNDFLKECDFQMIPSNSQLATLLGNAHDAVSE